MYVLYNIDVCWRTGSRKSSFLERLKNMEFVVVSMGTLEFHQSVAGRYLYWC